MNGNDAKGYAILLGVGAVAAVALFAFLKHQGKEAAAAVGGLVSGNNAATRGTAYEGAGVLGTIGAAADSASGGVLSGIGESIGGWFYDVTHSDYTANYDPRNGLQSGAKIVAAGGRATDALWGRVGSVELRS